MKPGQSAVCLLSLLILVSLLAASPPPGVVCAAPDSASAGSHSMTFPFDSAIQTLKTLEERVFPKAPEAPDAHGDATPATHAEASSVPSKKTVVLGAVYVDLVQRVPVHRATPLVQTRGLLASRSGQVAYERRLMPVDISPIILKHAGTHRIDPFLVKAVIFAESNFRNNATSYCGAQGLMQLMPGTGHMMGARDLYDPDQNIGAGTRYLRVLLDMYSGNLKAAIAAYNAGPGNVPKSGAIPNISETRNYVQKVMKAYKTFKDEAAKAD